MDHRRTHLSKFSPLTDSQDVANLLSNYLRQVAIASHNNEDCGRFRIVTKKKTTSLCALRMGMQFAAMSHPAWSGLTGEVPRHNDRTFVVKLI